MICVIRVPSCYNSHWRQKIKLTLKKSRTTITDIANELGISPSTVSRALNNHPAISKKTRNAVLKLARKRNYQPNLLALNLLKRKTNTIGIIVPEITSYFFSSIINGIKDVVKPIGVNMIIGQSNESYEEEKSIVQTFASIRVDGFLLSPSSETKKYYTHTRGPSAIARKAKGGRGGWEIGWFSGESNPDFRRERSMITHTDF